MIFYCAELNAVMMYVGATWNGEGHKRLWEVQWDLRGHDILALLEDFDWVWVAEL